MNDTFKATLRVPTSDMYAYIEIQAEGTIASLLEAYNEATRAVKVGVGLEKKEWNEVLVPRCRSCHVKKDKNWIKKLLTPNK